MPLPVDFIVDELPKRVNATRILREFKAGVFNISQVVSGFAVLGVTIPGTSNVIPQFVSGVKNIEDVLNAFNLPAYTPPDVEVPEGVISESNTKRQNVGRVIATFNKGDMTSDEAVAALVASGVEASLAGYQVELLAAKNTDLVSAMDSMAPVEEL